MNCSTPRPLLHFVTRRLRLRRYLKDPADGRQQTQIPTQTLLWALLVGQILRQPSFHAVEARIQGFQHSFVMINVEGTGLSLPFDGEPYGPAIASPPPGSACCGECSGAWENAWRSQP
jgi:hypothetical protein